MGVVEADDVVSDVGHGFVVIGVAALLDPLHFQVQQESLHDGVDAPQQLPLRLMLATSLCLASRSRWAWLAYWLPRSLCTIRPGLGWRRAMAICKAVQTNSAGMLGAIAQSTTLREYRSSTATRYSHPRPVRM